MTHTSDHTTQPRAAAIGGDLTLRTTRAGFAATVRGTVELVDAPKAWSAT